jgi:type IV pilus assembly protein PilV
MIKNLSDKKGLSLLEVLIAMLILAFGLLGLAPMILTSMYSHSFSDDITRANLIAQDKIELMKNQSSFSPLPCIEVTNNLEGIFTRTSRVDVDTTDGSVPAGVYRIRVTVNWTDKAGLNRRVNYYTYKMR